MKWFYFFCGSTGAFFLLVKANRASPNGTNHLFFAREWFAFNLVGFVFFSVCICCFIVRHNERRKRGKSSKLDEGEVNEYFVFTRVAVVLISIGAEPQFTPTHHKMSGAPCAPIEIGKLIFFSFLLFYVCILLFMHNANYANATACLHLGGARCTFMLRSVLIRLCHCIAMHKCYSVVLSELQLSHSISLSLA